MTFGELLATQAPAPTNCGTLPSTTSSAPRRWPPTTRQPWTARADGRLWDIDTGRDLRSPNPGK